jgi:AhpD family alkylhydroperoxidase
MKARIDFEKVLLPKAMQALYPIAKYVKSSGLDHRLLELVKMRTSQLNGCAYCIDMHSKDARAAGETEQRLYLLDAWRETPLYTERERAALEWTEAVTRLADGQVPDEVYGRARDHFSEEDLMNLTIAVIATNSFNRLNIAFRPEVGDYRPGMFD